MILSNQNAEAFCQFYDHVDVLALRKRIDNNIYKLWKVKPPKYPTHVNIFETLSKEGVSFSIIFI